MSKPRGRPQELDRPRPTTIVFTEDGLRVFKETALRQGKSISELVRSWAADYVRNHQENKQGKLDSAINDGNHFYMPTLGETPKRKFEKVQEADVADVIDILRNSAEWEHEAAAKLRRLGYSEEDIKKAMKGEKI